MKKILLFGPPFFNYTNQIKEEMIRLGYQVDYFNDRPSDIPAEKAILRVAPQILKGRVSRYLNDILQQSSGTKYDYIVVINGRALTGEFLNQLKQDHPESKTVLYLWDSLKLYPQTKSILQWADFSYSFDLLDCQENSVLLHLPLFYNNDFKRIASAKENLKYDLISVCTMHPNRYQFIKTHFPTFIKAGLTIFSWMYLNRLQYIYYKLTRPEFKTAKKTDFNFKSLPIEDYLERVAESRCVFDINHNMQTGLTMRTIETLGAKKKLITTNKYIVNYDMYTPENVYLIDLEKIDVNGILNFLKIDYKEYPKEIYEKYSLESFVLNLLGGNHA